MAPRPEPSDVGHGQTRAGIPVCTDEALETYPRTRDRGCRCEGPTQDVRGLGHELRASVPIPGLMDCSSSPCSGFRDDIYIWLESLGTDRHVSDGVRFHWNMYHGLWAALCRSVGTCWGIELSTGVSCGSDMEYWHRLWGMSCGIGAISGGV